MTRSRLVAVEWKRWWRMQTPRASRDAALLDAVADVYPWVTHAEAGERAPAPYHLLI
jgi:hypothetical protein